GAANRDDALFDGRIDVVNAESLIDGANLDGFGGHAEDDTSSFVLSDDETAGGLDGLAAVGAIVAHAREDRADAQRTRVSGDALHGDIDIGEVAVEPTGAAVKLDAAGRSNAEMLTT